MVDLDTLRTEDEKVAFWLNTYHTLMLHTYAERGHPSSSRELAKLLSTSSYNVGGHIFSLNDIEHAILRNSLPAPSSTGSLPGGGVVKFSKKDPRNKYIVSKVPPMLSLVLNCGSRSCPEISVYGGDQLIPMMERVASRFLKKTVLISKQKYQLVVQTPKQMGWYSRDFGDDKRACLSHIVPLLSEDHSPLLPDLMKSLTDADKKVKLKMEPLPFEWEFGCNLSLILG